MENGDWLRADIGWNCGEDSGREVLAPLFGLPDYSLSLSQSGGIPLPVEIDSFNAQPEAPARSGPTAKKAGASGWALNEQMYHFSPVGV